MRAVRHQSDGHCCLEIWGDGQSYAVFADLPSAFGYRPERRWAFTVDVQSGELTQHDSRATAAKELTAGLTRFAWNPYRPCDSAVSSTRIRRCPVCRGKLLPIQWGMPGPDAVAAYERGEVALGGCDQLRAAIRGQGVRCLRLDVDDRAQRPMTRSAPW